MKYLIFISFIILVGCLAQINAKSIGGYDDGDLMSGFLAGLGDLFNYDDNDYLKDNVDSNAESNANDLKSKASGERDYVGELEHIFEDWLNQKMKDWTDCYSGFKVLFVGSSEEKDAATDKKKKKKTYPSITQTPKVTPTTTSTPTTTADNTGKNEMASSVAKHNADTTKSVLSTESAPVSTASAAGNTDNAATQPSTVKVADNASEATSAATTVKP